MAVPDGAEYFGGKAFGPQMAQMSADEKYGGTNQDIEPAIASE
jgi:hypothetical protein